MNRFRIWESFSPSKELTYEWRKRNKNTTYPTKPYFIYNSIIETHTQIGGKRSSRLHWRRWCFVLYLCVRVCGRNRQKQNEASSEDKMSSRQQEEDDENENWIWAFMNGNCGEKIICCCFFFFRVVWKVNGSKFIADFVIWHSHKAVNKQHKNQPVRNECAYVGSSPFGNVI